MSSIDARAFPYEFVRPRSRRDRIARLDAFANLFDTAFVIPGTNVRFGIDALIGLAPGIGDVITTGMSLWLLYEARKLGGNAVVGVDLDYETITMGGGGGMLMVTASGTAVVTE